MLTTAVSSCLRTLSSGLGLHVNSRAALSWHQFSYCPTETRGLTHTAHPAGIIYGKNHRRERQKQGRAPPYVEPPEGGFCGVPGLPAGDTSTAPRGLVKALKHRAGGSLLIYVAHTFSCVLWRLLVSTTTTPVAEMARAFQSW